MKLNLKNPIVFFDLETTGTSINADRIVEICYLKVHPNGNEEAKTLRINPEMHIPEEASAIHGIYDADVADCPTFKEVASGLVTVSHEAEGIADQSTLAVTVTVYVPPVAGSTTDDELTLISSGTIVPPSPPHPVIIKVPIIITNKIVEYFFIIVIRFIA